VTVQVWLNPMGVGGAMSFLLGVEQIGETINKLLVGLMLGYAFTDTYGECLLVM